jgi:hypothetical protein
MALVTWASIEAALADVFYDDISNQINRAVVLAQLLPFRPGTGKNIQWLGRFGTATPTTAVIADGADVTTFNSDDKVPAVLQFGTYHDAFSLTGKALAAARAAGNPAELAALLVENMGESIERLSRAIAEHVYIGDGSTNTIHGLHATVPAIGDTGVYAGIDRAVRTQWKGNVVDANGGALSFALIRQLRRVIYQASSRKPDLFITDPVQHEKLGLLYGAERRYTDEVRRNDGTRIRLDGGYQVLEFDGIAVVEDAQHPAQKFSAINTDYMYLTQLADSPDVLNRAMGTTALGGTPEEQYGATRMKLSARIQPLAITGDAFKFQLILYPQVVVRIPNACGYIDELAA